MKAKRNHVDSMFEFAEMVIARGSDGEQARIIKAAYHRSQRAQTPLEMARDIKVIAQAMIDGESSGEFKFDK